MDVASMSGSAGSISEQSWPTVWLAPDDFLQEEVGEPESVVQVSPPPPEKKKDPLGLVPRDAIAASIEAASETGKAAAVLASSAPSGLGAANFTRAKSEGEGNLEDKGNLNGNVSSLQAPGKECPIVDANTSATATSTNPFDDSPAAAAGTPPHKPAPTHLPKRLSREEAALSPAGSLPPTLPPSAAQIPSLHQSLGPPKQLSPEQKRAGKHRRSHSEGLGAPFAVSIRPQQQQPSVKQQDSGGKTKVAVRLDPPPDSKSPVPKASPLLDPPPPAKVTPLLDPPPAKKSNTEANKKAAVLPRLDPPPGGLFKQGGSL